MHYIIRTIIIFFTLTTVILFCNQSYAKNDWLFTVYGAKLSANNLGETLTWKAHYEDSYLLSMSLARRIFSFREIVDFEFEGQAVTHFGDQGHLEFNVLPVIRWLPFPWDDVFLDTNFAIGAGLSYATETPEIEALGVNHTPKLLGYLMLELAFHLPRAERYAFVTRIHHRSGADGLFSGRLDASNAIGFGIKYIF